MNSYGGIETLSKEKNKLSRVDMIPATSLTYIENKACLQNYLPYFIQAIFSMKI